MRKTALLVTFVLASSMAMALKKEPGYLDARRNGAEAKLEIFVADNDGTAVSNASVKVFMGMNFRAKGYWIEGDTNEKGVFVVQGKTCGDEIVIHASKEGFYNSRLKLCFAEMGAEREVKNGKWLPYGTVETLRLRKIINPITLNCFGFGAGKDVPVTNMWIGVDMEQGDFVSPHGKGKQEDFEIKVEWDGRTPPRSDYCMLALRFSGEMAGGYYANKVAESEYPYVYAADIHGRYDIRNLEVVGRDKDRRESAAVFRQDSVFVTRSRCIVDEEGNLKSACYGFIRLIRVDAGWDGRPTMRLAGVFNPTPNDTNLEPK